MNAPYYNDTNARIVDNLQTDEMMIVNMLNALNNPLIVKMMDEAELLNLCQVVKMHVVSRANAISNT